MNHKQISPSNPIMTQACDPTHQPDRVEAIVKLLRQSGVVPLPTETVYGLAGNAYDSVACQAIFTLKQRPTTSPLIVHYGDREQLKRDVVWHPLYDLLADAFWPGPLTLVMKRRSESALSSLVSAGQETVAVRIPDAPWMLHTIRRLGCPLAAPSANPSGSISPTCVDHVKSFWGDKLPLYVEGGVCRWGLESTLVDLGGLRHPTRNRAVILRPGVITESEIRAVWPGEVVDIETLEMRESQVQESSRTASPGRGGRHYAPKKKLRLEVTSVEAHEGLLAFGPTVLLGAAVTLNLSPTSNLEEAAHRLFSFLRHLDALPQCHSLAVMPLPQEGLGRALNNRLNRASLAV